MIKERKKEKRCVSVYPHIDFNELADYLFLEKPEQDFAQKAAVINSHLVQCEECRAQYQAILRFKQTIDQLQNRHTQSFSSEITL